ncbi:hypothetical protein K432DRAFT_221062 [Lepidopterella palustris CBS 459.81]|uniref:CHK kinase-like domain-containing protein n=1 Tax=Lepidopterella palustris CBS 459.81 TaxID=1314670 RepID=A0A8E2EEM7_9PEZI|nr:hypothetical protein K432DRAFT_221062 [Lepidopterella palustris CBS 459.81]
MAPIDTPTLHTHALAALEAADLMLATAPELNIDVVHTMDQVTDEFLTEALGSSVPGAKVVSSSIVGGHEGMTSRHKWRLVWNEAGTAAGLPTAIFFKATPDNAHLREMLSLLHMAELESNVYNQLSVDLEPSGLIPKCYYARAYLGGRFLIILEDLEARAVPVKVHWMADTTTIPYARQVAIAQAKIHAKYWNSPRFDGDMVWVRPRQRRFGELWLRKFFTRNRKMFLESADGKGCSNYVRELIEMWDRECVKVYAYWDAKPPTILHGDSHMGNVLEYADGTAGYYDWQCLFRGYGYRDLSYFLMSALTVDDCKKHEREIFDLYTDTLAQEGVEVEREEAWLDYCLLSLERFDSAMTSLSNGGYGHGRSAFERQVDTIGKRAEEHDVKALLERVVRTGSVLPEKK